MDIKPVWIAARFLTRFPLPDPGPADPADLGRAVPWYPAVGLAMGLALAASGWLLGGFAPPSGLAAALVLAFWVWCSGALHLDGLADSADAWVGGLGSRARTLEIMKDPASGPIGVVSLVLVLIVKYSAIEALLAAGAWSLLLWPPLLARATLPLLMVSTPYVRPGGLGALQARWAPPLQCRVSAGLSGLAAWLWLGWLGLMVTVAVAALYAWIRRALLARLGGFTGDTAGALVELAESLALVLLASLAG